MTDFYDGDDPYNLSLIQVKAQYGFIRDNLTTSDFPITQLENDDTT
jgi:hypothetical protein